MDTNRLYFGDNLRVMREKIATESVDLIYLDPPFNSQRNYFVLFQDRTGKASAAQEAAFEDTWVWNTDSEAHFKELVVSCPNQELSTLIKALRTVLRESPMMAYVTAMAIRILEMHRVLKPTGSLYLHCDPTASHYLKLVLDVVFEPTNFRNEITWKRADAHNDAKKQFACISDRLLLYVKSKAAMFNTQYGQMQEKTLKDWYQYLEFPDGTTRRMTKEECETQVIPKGARRFNTDNLRSPNPRPNLTYDYKGYKPHQNGWAVSLEKMQELDKAGLLLFPSSTDGRIMRKKYLDESPGVVVGDVWTDISQIRGTDSERLGYPTQKPLALLRRVIEASSNLGDVILDPFCGCGTAMISAHELNRHWIGIDLTAVAIAVIKSRLENTFDDLKGKVVVDGFPSDFESARQLFELDTHRFQIWACTLIDAYPLTKKGADAGIDGWLNFVDWDDKPHRGVVQVKGGKVQVGLVRDFCHVVKREEAALGFFICMGEVTKPMRDEANKEGFWTSVSGKDYPKIQILSVADLLDRKDSAKLPPQDKASILGFKAQGRDKQGQQKGLFEE